MTERYQPSPFGMAKPGQKTVNLGDMYGVDKLHYAQDIWKSYVQKNGAGGSYAEVKDALRDMVVKPRLAHINEITGQENDPDFLAYQLIAVFQELRF